MRREFDVAIVGGGPGGLSAALVLGRCRRRVLLCDSGRPRNAAARTMHGFLTRDGIAPATLRAAARRQLAPYDVTLLDAEVAAAHRLADGFALELAGGNRMKARKLLLATGVVDEIPALDGIERFYGASVHHCPYCDGWEQRGLPLAAYGRGLKGAGLAIALRAWSGDVVLFSDGAARLRREWRQRLARHGIAIIEEPVAALSGRGSSLAAVVLESGVRVPRRALFFATSQSQACNLVTGLGCELNARGTARTRKLERTSIPGLFVAGDCSADVQLAVVAAAEGAKAAVAINTELIAEDFR